MKVNSQNVKARREQIGHQSNPPTLQMGKLRFGEVNNLLVSASQFFLLYVLPPPPYPGFLCGSRPPAPLASEGLHHQVPQTPLNLGLQQGAGPSHPQCCGGRGAFWGQSTRLSI